MMFFEVIVGIAVAIALGAVLGLFASMLVGQK